MPRVWCAAVLLVAWTARADQLRVRIPLTWEHVPRTAELESKQQAAIPNGVVIYSRFPSGVRSFAIAFDSGFWCSTTGAPGELITLGCGNAVGRYQLVQSAGKQAELDWVYEEQAAAPPKGEKS